MTSADPTWLERIEANACADFYRAAPADVVAAHRVDCFEIGSAVCLVSSNVDPALVFRRVVGLGIGASADEPQLRDIVTAMEERCTSYSIQVAPHAKPRALSGWLEARGFSPGYAWMKFARPARPEPAIACDLEIRVADAGLATAFGTVVTTGFEMPASTAPWVAALAGRPAWTCVLALDGAEAVAAGAVYIDSGYAWLGLGTTLASHRGRGAQTALLAYRIGWAARSGAQWLVTETGERVAGKPAQSYRNILRAGFGEVYVRPNYVSPQGS